MKKIYKLLMNAIYGKLGMDVINTSFAIDDGSIVNKLNTVCTQI
jgi:hypothetical protein